MNHEIEAVQAVQAVYCRGPVRSGVLITVDFAADQGREVFVGPGSVLSDNSACSLRPLSDGSGVIGSVADILDDLRIGQRREDVAVKEVLPLNVQRMRLMNQNGFTFNPGSCCRKVALGFVYLLRGEELRLSSAPVSVVREALGIVDAGREVDVRASEGIGWAN